MNRARERLQRGGDFSEEVNRTEERKIGPKVRRTPLETPTEKIGGWEDRGLGTGD